MLPLHIFEPRYRQLVHDLARYDNEFGVALIDRGSEVGGGEQRSSLGTIAQVLSSEEADDGRWFITCVGTRRFIVDQWLPDAPYPMAQVTELVEPPASADVAESYAQVRTKLDQTIELIVELTGQPLQGSIDISDDPSLGCHQIAALSAFGPLDSQRLLRAEDATQRCGLLHELLDDRIELLRAQLKMRD